MNNKLKNPLHKELLLGLLALGFLADVHAETYEVNRSTPHKIGTYQSGTYMGITSLNNAGIAVGFSEVYFIDPIDGIEITGPWSAVRWDLNSTSPTPLEYLGETHPNSNARATSINDVGDVFGTSYVSDYGIRGTFPVRWPANSLTPLLIGGVLAEISSGRGYSVLVGTPNDSGIAIGWSYLYENSVNKGKRAVRWPYGGIATQNLGTLGTDTNGSGFSVTTDLNNAGVVVGDSTLYENGMDRGPRAVRWAAGSSTPQILGTLGVNSDGIGGSRSIGLNDAGVVVGESSLYENGVFKGRRAVRWAAGSTTPQNLGTLGTDSNGNGSSFTSGLNEAGVIIGSSTLYENGVSIGERAARWAADSTTPQNLGTLFGHTHSVAIDLNDVGVVVGSSSYGDPIYGDSRAVRWNAQGEIEDLNNLLSPVQQADWVLINAFEITNSGKILVGGYHLGVFHYAILNPVATPTPTPGDADVFLLRLQVPKGVKPRAGGRTLSKKVTVGGDGDTMKQDATVMLTWEAFGAVTVAVTPGSVKAEVNPGGGATKFRFSAEIACVGGAEGASGAIRWFAKISAGENSDPTNDELEGRTDVTCRKPLRGGKEQGSPSP